VQQFDPLSAYVAGRIGHPKRYLPLYLWLRETRTGQARNFCGDLLSN
jgi:hypothetical protein